MNQLRSFRWSFGQALTIVPFAVLWAWLNTRKTSGFAVAQGFPICFAVLSDDGNKYFDGMALLTDFAIGLATGILIWKYAPKWRTHCSRSECFVIGTVAAAFSWANWERWWDGWRPTELGFTNDSEFFSSGFPFVYTRYIRGVGTSFCRTGIHAVNLILCATLLALSYLFHRRAPIAHHRAAARRK